MKIKCLLSLLLICLFGSSYAASQLCQCTGGKTYPQCYPLQCNCAPGVAPYPSYSCNMSNVQKHKNTASATFYGGDESNSGGCGYGPISKGYKYTINVAPSESLYANGKNCGRYVKITPIDPGNNNQPYGTAIVAQITNSCPPGNYLCTNHLNVDLNTAAAKGLDLPRFKNGQPWGWLYVTVSNPMDEPPNGLGPARVVKAPGHNCQGNNIPILPINTKGQLPQTIKVTYSSGSATGTRQGNQAWYQVNVGTNSNLPTTINVEVPGRGSVAVNWSSLCKTTPKQVKQPTTKSPGQSGTKTPGGPVTPTQGQPEAK